MKKRFTLINIYRDQDVLYLAATANNNEEQRLYEMQMN
jgi:hypothetical protein